MEVHANKYDRMAGSLQEVSDELVRRLRHTFGPRLRYVGTTTELGQEVARVRDIDFMVVVDEVSEGALYYCGRLVRHVQGRYGVPLHVRLYSSEDLLDSSGKPPLVARYLLSILLQDLHGTSPLHGVDIDPDSVTVACMSELESASRQILDRVSSVSWGPLEVQELASIVFEAVRAFLVLEGQPRAGKDEAYRHFRANYTDFDELDSIYRSYVNPTSVTNFVDFVLDAHAIVKHLHLRALRLPVAERVVLINTPSSLVPHPRYEYLLDDANMPLGLVCVGTYLRTRGTDVRVIDACAENLGALSVVERLVADHHFPLVVGLNCTSPNVHVVQALARFIKRTSPNTVVVAGGPHPTLAPEHTLSTGHIDYAVIGEGERSFDRLVHHLFEHQSEPFAPLPGIASRVADKTVCQPENEPLPLDELPTPDFGLLPWEMYFSARRRLYVHSSRGCNFRCVYCSVPKCYGGHVKEMPLEQLVSDLQYYQTTYSAEEFQIVDDNFSHKVERVRQFCRMYRAGGLRMRWKCQARADQLDVETIKSMAQAGCFEIDLGIESGNEEIQRYIGKRLDLARTEQTVKAISDAGVYCKAFFMLGFPGEEYAQMQETINFAVRLKTTGLRDVAFFPVMPFPGTRLADECGEVVLQGALIDDFNVLDATYAGRRMRKYSAKPEKSLNRLLDREQLRLLIRYAYQMFSLGKLTDDLRSEFAEYAEIEEGVMYGA